MSADSDEEQEAPDQILASAVVGADGTFAVGVQLSQTVEYESEPPQDGQSAAGAALQVAGKTVETAGHLAGKVVEAIGRAFSSGEQESGESSSED